PRMRLRTTGLLCTALVVALAVASMLLGAGQLGVVESLLAWLGKGDEEAVFVVHALRGPRTLLAILVGIALGAAGAVMPAASPDRWRPSAACRSSVRWPARCSLFWPPLGGAPGRIQYGSFLQEQPSPAS